MENEKDEKIKVVVEKDDVERLRKEIEEMKKIREDEQKEKIVAEKKRYDEDMEKLKSELEDKKKEIEQAKQQMSKPQPQQSVVMTYDKYKTEYGKTPIDTIREQLPNLSLGELIVLQAEYDTNRALPESTRRLLMNQPPKEMGVEVQAKNKIGG